MDELVVIEFDNPDCTKKAANMPLKLEQLESREVPAVMFFSMTDTLRAYDEGGNEVWEQRPFGEFPGTVSLAAGDVNGDGTVDAILGAGKGGGPRIRVLNGLNGDEMMSFFAYVPAFSGGVNVASGDINHDGKAEIITGAGPGGGPHVQVWDGATQNILQSFFAGPADYRGGVNVASYGSTVSTQLIREELQSRPSASKSLFLSFGDSAPTELIHGIWQQVADYFAPYNINITTVQPSGPANRWDTISIGGSGAAAEGWAANDLQESTLGVSIVNGFYESTAFQNKPAQVFADKIGWSNPVMIGRAIAHEAGHLFGLDHSTDPNSVMNSNLLPGIGGWDFISALILSQRLGAAN